MLIVEQEHIMEISNLMKITRRSLYIQHWFLQDTYGHTAKLLFQLKKLSYATFPRHRLQS